MKNEKGGGDMCEIHLEGFLMKELEDFALAYKLDKRKVLNKILLDGLKRKKSIFRSVEKQKENLGDKR